MMTALLAERFQLKTRRETKDFPAYGLVIGKSELKLKESETAPAPSDVQSVEVAAGGGPLGVTANLGGGATFSVGNNRIEARKMTMNAFAIGLTRFLDRPAIDMTGLTKRYDFTLASSPEDYIAMMIRAALAAGAVLPPEAMKALDNSSGDSLFAAVQALGLKLEPRKAPLEVIVVDHIEKTPTEN